MKKETLYFGKKMFYFLLVPLIALLPFLWGAIAGQNIFTGEEIGRLEVSITLAIIFVGVLAVSRVKR